LYLESGLALPKRGVVVVTERVMAAK